MTLHLRYLVKWTLVPKRALPSITATICQLSSQSVFPTGNLLSFGNLVFGQRLKGSSVNLSQDLSDHPNVDCTKKHARSISDPCLDPCLHFTTISIIVIQLTTVQLTAAFT